MKSKYCRYSKQQLNSLGLSGQFNDQKILVDYEFDKIQTEKLVKGQFKNIIDTLYTSTDGSLDNNVRQFVSESSPSSVKSFIQNVLLCDVQSLRSAPDDETAFNCLIPRSAQTSSELAPYIDYIKSTIKVARSDSSNTD